MNCLLLDTSCPRAVVVVAIDGRVAAKQYLHETKQHSEFLSPCVADLVEQAGLTMNDLNLVAVGKGPGSFIGVRIAMAYAKGLCIALGIPLIGVGTLSAIAHEPGLPLGRGMALIDARRGEYYVQTFERTKEAALQLDTPHLHPASDLLDLTQTCNFLVGTSLLELSQQSTRTQVYPVDGPTAEGLLTAFAAQYAQSQTDETLTLVPDYVRDPDAKKML